MRDDSISKCKISSARTRPDSVLRWPPRSLRNRLGIRMSRHEDYGRHDGTYHAWTPMTAVADALVNSERAVAATPNASFENKSTVMKLSSRACVRLHELRVERTLVTESQRSLSALRTLTRASPLIPVSGQHLTHRRSLSRALRRRVGRYVSFQRAPTRATRRHHR